jgi:serine/threonine protein kinase
MSARPPHLEKLARSVKPGAALPAHIGKYPIRAKLGSGATSQVFLGHDAFHGRDVAIKRFKTDFIADEREQFYQRCFFASEAALVGRLQHPNVVQIFDAVDDEVAPYLVMEYVPGVTLRRFCRAHALLPLEQVLEIGFKCAMALGYMYREGLVHRDVKPANLLAVLDGAQIVDVKVSDFGSALNLRSDRTQVYRVGSLAYMAPEQLDGDVLDCRADIYSLAAVLYHLIAGRPPFDATQQAAIMHQIHHAEPPPLQSLRDGVTPLLASTLHKALSKRRGDRQADWDEFALALSGIVARGELPRGPLQSVLDSERFTLLRQLEFFAGFGDVELWEVVHRARWQRHTFGDALYRKGEAGNSFHIIAAGQVEVYRDGVRVAQLGAGTSVGEMAYLAPSPDLATNAADVLVSDAATTLSFMPQTMDQLSVGTRALFDKAFIGVLVRRLHAAHEALHHPRRIL